MNFQLAKYSLLKKFSENIGFTTPEECGAIFKYLIENVKTDRQIIYSPHCHDDLGMAVALNIRQDYYQVETSIVLNETINTSEMVSRFSGIPVPKNKAVVGGNTFSHESGIHQDGVLKNPLTYEIITPELVGVKIPLGKLSGRHAFVEKLRELALDFTEEDIKPLFAKFKALADKK
ncbi:2-isopropylmalate synthase [Streptococcus pneumoniae]|nr:2-isopropylmalate synthase [Streptococcus pneumoniae]CEX98688.1 2-isopropylmalate synthase [Streptococcus pneumoniae]CEY43469.1 2-isopropylmalate synthase [Streptococcus pneumoniae]CIO92179.1 2-isopropylmalate synthase [Streptococcus pneumoniae]CIS91124.1 2-isopropylmalate synthase [Streptococcus pneumoniae]